MVEVNRQPVVESEERHFPFDVRFQQALLRLLCEDYVFGVRAIKHLTPEYFEHETLGWVYSCITRHVATYGTPPSVHVLQDMTRQLDPQIAGFYGSVVEHIRQADLRDADWLKDQVLEFVRRNLFVRAYQEGRQLYNSGKTTQAYDMMMEQMSTIERTTWDPIDRSWLHEELGQRQALRRQQALVGDAVPTGFDWLDKILNGGLHLGEMGLWLAYAKVGKALRDDQLVRTPTGWVPISRLKIGDPIIGGSTGKPQIVLGVFPQGVRELFEVSFSDGSSAVASGDHLWRVQTGKTVQRRKGPQWVVMKTTELPTSRRRYLSAWLPPTPVVEGKGNPLKMDPYLFGLLLGDGSFVSATIRFTKPEPDVMRAIQTRLPAGDRAIIHRAKKRLPYITIVTDSPGRTKVAKELESLGLMGCRSPQKFIPSSLFQADASVRFQVLCGLCDTDGFVDPKGKAIEFCSASKVMAEGVLELVRSLGGHGSIRTKMVDHRAYCIVFFTMLGDWPLPVLSHKNRKKVRKRQTKKWRRVASIKKVAPARCTCIAVDDPEGLFITNDYVVTHNSTMLIQHGMAAVRCGIPVLHIVLEGSRALIENRYDAGFTGELYANIKSGQMEAHRYQAAMQEYTWLKGLLVIRSFVDKWDVSILDIEEELRDLKRSRNWVPKLIVADYMDLMTGRDKKYYRSETESQRAAYRDGKRLAGRGYALWTASQAQRPKKEDHTKCHLLTSSSVADTYEKVRACDFLGSLNQTDAERSADLRRELGHWVLRAYAEMYRDNAANQQVVLAMDPDHMRIWAKPGLESPSDPAATSEASLVDVNGKAMTQGAAF